MADLLQLDEALARQESSEALIHLMRQLVNTYLDPKEVNRKAAESWERGRTEDTPVPAVDILEKGPAAIVPA
jgi:hypothetical protein